ncbi:hypothetical protein, partial [Halobacillus sp. BBL2006]|uniref:hypothetical protein n=1 Tax=Halobacillus sp. BBL2006 TaxID=1543706 RepID=UPI000542B342
LPDGNIFCKAMGEKDATDMKVYDKDTEKVLSEINSRAIPYPTKKELLFSGDQYHLRSVHELQEHQQLTIIAMVILVNIELHT